MTVRLLARVGAAEVGSVIGSWMMDRAVQDNANRNRIRGDQARAMRCVSSEKRWDLGLRSGELEPPGSSPELGFLFGKPLP